MAITYNAKGTSYPSFMIGKRGPTLYQTALPESSEKGDIFIDTTNGILQISNGTTWSTFLESDTAASTYITKVNPISTGKISFDSGKITSDGEGNLTLAGLSVPSVNTSAVVLTSGTMNITAPTLDFSNSGAVKSVTPAAGDSSTNVATTAFVETAIAGFSSDPLIGPTVDFGDKTKAVTSLELDFYQSGPPTTGSATQDAQITVTSGVAGVENSGTLTVNSSVINVNASSLMTTADEIRYIASNIVYRTPMITFSSPNTTQDGNGWGFVFVNSTGTPVSGIAAVNTEDALRGGLFAIGTSFQYGDSSDSSAPAPYSLTFQTSANAGINDFTILASGGTTTANGGTLEFTGSKLDLTGVTDVVSTTPVSTDNSTTVATTAYVQSNLSSYAKESALSSYLTTAAASTTYATKTSLDDYLTISNAETTYATNTSLADYLTTADAGTTYLTKDDASTTYATSTSLSSYLKSTDASTTYLSKTDAASTYATAASLADYLTTADAVADYVPLSGGVLTGYLQTPTPLTADNTKKVATTAYVQSNLESYATTSSLSSYATTASLSDYLTTSKAATTYLPLTGGTVTGTLKSTTPVSTDSSTTVATTAYVQSNLTNYLTTTAASSTYATKTSLASYLTTATAASTYLPLTGGSLTGTLTVPTPTAGDISTKVATTAYVQNAISSNDVLSGPEVIYGSKTTSLEDGLSLDYYISGPPTTGSVTTDAQISITGGTAGTANEATIQLNASTVDMATDIKTVLVPTVASSSDSSTNAASTAFVQSVAGNYLPLTGGDVSGSLYADFIGTGLPSTAGNAHMSFYSSGSGYGHSDCDIRSSGGTGNNDGTMNIAARRLNCLADMSLGSIVTPLTVTGNSNCINFVSGSSSTDTSGNITYSSSSNSIYWATAGDAGATTTALIRGQGGTVGSNQSGVLLYDASAHNFTGAVTVPTPAVGDNSANAASTAFVKSNYLGLGGGNLSGGLGVSGPIVANNSIVIEDVAATAARDLNFTNYNGGQRLWAIQARGVIDPTSSATTNSANLSFVAWPDNGGTSTTVLTINRGTGIAAFSASPQAPTPTAGDSSTKVATTAFVAAAIAGSSNSGVNTYKVSDLPSSTSAAVGDIAFATDGCKPGEDSGSGSGTPVFYDGTSWINFGTFKTVTA